MMPFIQKTLRRFNFMTGNVFSPNLTTQQKLQTISDVTNLKTAFPAIAAKDAYKVEKQWNKFAIAGVLALGALAICAYKKAHQYVAIGLGVLAAGVCTKLRSTLHIPTELLNTQEIAIQRLFAGAALEFKTAFIHTSSAIAAAINAQKDLQDQTVEKANQKATELLVAFKNTSASTTVDSFDSLPTAEKEWREFASTTLFPAADKIANLKMDDLAKEVSPLSPIALKELQKVQVEAKRLVFGTPGGDDKTPYVQNVAIPGDKGAPVITATPWPIKG
jgi:hypothetical protein